MDKVFSARIDESVARCIGDLARRLRVSKKKVIEDAVRTYAEKIESDDGQDVFERTAGAWRRTESAARLVDEARKAFRDSMNRRSR
jgi:predicted transcriptional regulator